MQALIKLFSKSPFSPLQKHMDKVASCVVEILPLFSALEKKEYAVVATIAKKVSKLEHEADLTKNDIRNHLPSGIFLPIARASLLEILALQDNIADKVEDIALLLTLRKIEIEALLKEEFYHFLHKNLETFHKAHQLIQEMPDLLESSFGGSEAEKVRHMVEDIAFKEHESDLLQKNLLKKFFTKCDHLPAPSFFLWMQVVQAIAFLSNESEKLANRIRMTLEIK